MFALDPDDYPPSPALPPFQPDPLIGFLLCAVCGVGIGLAIGACLWL